MSAPAHLGQRHPPDDIEIMERNDGIQARGNDASFVGRESIGKAMPDGAQRLHHMDEKPFARATTPS
jgi:hypothetical protein